VDERLLTRYSDDGQNDRRRSQGVRTRQDRGAYSILRLVTRPAIYGGWHKSSRGMK
jgi:hypothetical protein